MSHICTVYFNDPGIELTSIYSYEAMRTYTGSYGDDFLTLNVSDGFAIRLEADASNGSNFSHWLYRLGSTTSTQRTSYDNPFEYSGNQDIYIRAVSTTGGGSADSGITAYIYTGTQWQKAVPYIYTGTQWQKVTPKIFT